MTDPLGLFHPLVRAWFAESVGTPTDIQRLAWPRIAAGEHVLISAPTGSGKTLTAFLWALDRLLTGDWRAGGIRVLYVSPLRALNSDIRRNLEGPLEALARRFDAAGEAAPRVRVLTRSGDTPQSERRKMLRHPPEILVTTPESLNILLTSQSGRGLLDGLEAVILDEIHAVVDSKRGTHLITAVDRLVPLSGEFQRIALSATVRPMETVAEFVGGFEIDGAPDDWKDGIEPNYRPRRVEILRSTAEKRYEVRVRFPGAGAGTTADLDDGREDTQRDDDAMWDVLAEDFRQRIRGNRSTLLFANSRRTTEKVTRLVNAGDRVGEMGGALAYSHHGSLSREVRTAVESKLKKGELKAIVATNSLELGIDIGSLDEVVMVQTPRSVASAVQRVGRAGHGVGETSRGVFYPTHGRDLMEAAVVARAVVDQAIEERRPVTQPLDVLAQVVLSMTCAEPWPIDALYHQLRASWPYRNLPRKLYDLVLDMLAGRYSDSRIRELRPRILLDRVRGTVKGRKGMERMIYLSGGTIADRGYFALRHVDTMAKIGELDEEFVWERSIGDTFSLGAQAWRIQRITHNDVLVRPGRGASSAMAPFWKADAADRGFELCQQIAGFLESVESRLGRDDLQTELESDFFMESPAAEELRSFLAEQKAATGGKLPRRDRLLVERCGGPVAGLAPGFQQVIVHSWWGGKVHRPLAMAIQAAWEERSADPLEIYHDDACLMLRLPEDVAAGEVLGLVAPDQVEDLLRRKLERTGFFGSRFRWAAQTAMLLPKAGFRQRTPLWLNRQRSKKLLDSVIESGDFPVVVETWRTCLRDEFELDHLKKQLVRLRSGELPVVEVSTSSPSPLASNLVWQYTNQYMYENDAPEGSVGAKGGVRPELLRELVFSADLRPRLPQVLVDDFEAKAQRTADGYAPAPGDELSLWLRERVAVPDDEWRRLLAAVARDHDADPAEVVADLEPRSARLRLPGAEIDLVVDLETVSRLRAALGSASVGELDLRSLAAPDEPLRGAARERLAALDAGSGSVEEDEEGDADEVSTDDESLLRLADLVGEWLRAYGPVPLTRLRAVWGLDGSDLDSPDLDDLLATFDDTRAAVVDALTVGATHPEVCDAENLELLLRRLRLDQRPSFEALGTDYLPLFVALHQGVADPGAGLDGLQERLEQLFGWPERAALWETEFLPARLRPYYPSWLDSAMQGSDLLWVGCGKERLTFGFDADLELFFDAGDGPWAAQSTDREQDEPSASQFFPPGRDRAELDQIVGGVDLPALEVHDRLWSLAWESKISHDAYLPVRRGLATGFDGALALESPRRAAARRSVRGRSTLRGSPSGSRGRWGTGSQVTGSWVRLDRETPELDVLEREELGKDRARLLLQRYGVLFRQLVDRELPALRWSSVFRALRIMELSGEVLAGHFFRGVRGLQFIARGAFRDLAKGLPEDAIYWLCAADPASLCGVDIEGLKETLPARRASTHLVFHGRSLVLLSHRRGKDLDLRVDVDHPRLVDYFLPLEHLLTREVDPLTSVRVETIDGEPASRHPLARHLDTVFRVTREGDVLRLWKRY